MIEDFAASVEKQNTHLPIQLWKWSGLPLSVPPTDWTSLFEKVFFEEIDWVIQSADSTEALTSPSTYIRECRRWFDAQRS